MPRRKARSATAPSILHILQAAARARRRPPWVRTCALALQVSEQLAQPWLRKWRSWKVEKYVRKYLLWADDKLAAHHLVPRFAGKGAVERERARPIGLELECRRSAGGNPLGDPVIVDGEAVGDVLTADGHLDEIVLAHLDARRRELEILGGNGEFAPVR